MSTELPPQYTPSLRAHAWGVAWSLYILAMCAVVIVCVVNAIAPPPPAQRIGSDYGRAAHAAISRHEVS